MKPLFFNFVCNPTQYVLEMDNTYSEVTKRNTKPSPKRPIKQSNAIFRKTLLNIPINTRPSIIGHNGCVIKRICTRNNTLISLRNTGRNNMKILLTGPTQESINSTEAELNQIIEKKAQRTLPQPPATFKESIIFSKNTYEHLIALESWITSPQAIVDDTKIQLSYYRVRHMDDGVRVKIAGVSKKLIEHAKQYIITYANSLESDESEEIDMRLSIDIDDFNTNETQDIEQLQNAFDNYKRQRANIISPIGSEWSYSAQNSLFINPPGLWGV